MPKLAIRPSTRGFLIHREACFPPCFVRQNQQKKKKMRGDFRPLSNKNLQMWDHFFPLLFPKGSESLKILDIRLREMGAKRRLNGTSKVNRRTDGQTDKQTDRQTDISTYRKHRHRGPMLWKGAPNIGPKSLVFMIFTRPKRGRPTPGFSIFLHSDRASERASDRPLFFSRDQILVPTHSLRDKGTKGQHRNRGTKGQNRNKGTTQERRNTRKKETMKQRNKGTNRTKELGNLVTW